MHGNIAAVSIILNLDSSAVSETNKHQNLTKLRHLISDMTKCVVRVICVSLLILETTMCSLTMSGFTREFFNVFGYHAIEASDFISPALYFRF